MVENKEYWEKFYKQFKYCKPSKFVKFAIKYIPEGSKVLDAGCGNGRDTYFLGQYFDVIGVDYAIKPKKKKDNKARFIKKDLRDLFREKNTFDVIYSRLLLNNFWDDEIIRFLKWSKGSILLIECRAKGDQPKLFQHKRNLVDGNILLDNLLRLEYDILYYIKSKGLSPFRGEDPLFIRIIARS